ncbi:hypothetical protein H4S03_006208 [Coemansia sp. S3946]|nr:hypothetical protein H4S03_006208 [Coemansia sp. S3946]
MLIGADGIAMNNREAIAELTDRTPFEMYSPMIIIGDLNSRLGQLSGDHGDNHRAHILEAHIRATDMEVMNTRLPVPQMTFSNHNGSSIVDLVLAEPAAKATILDFWVAEANDDDARDKYHRLVDDGFKEWAEEAKRLLALDPNTTTFEKTTAALESPNDDFCSIIRDAMEQSVG